MKLSPITLGILSSAAACAFFTLADALTKLLVARYPVFEVMGIEFFLSALLVLLWARISEGKNFKAAVRLHRRDLHLYRGLFQFISNALIAFSFLHMSLAEFYVILFLAPLLVALLASRFLGEKPPLSLGLVMLVSFAGVLIALRPAAGFSIWALVAFAGTATNAVTSTFIRKMMPTETAISPAYSAGLIVGVLCGLLSLFHFVMPSAADFGLLLLMGLIYAAGQVFLVRAFRLAPAPFAASAQFLQLPYGAVVGFFLFRDVPSVWIYIGGGVVIAANLFLLYTQNRKTATLLS